MGKVEEDSESSSEDSDDGAVTPAKVSLGSLHGLPALDPSLRFCCLGL